MCSQGWIFYEKSCGPSTYVVALDEPDSIGPRVSGYLEPVVPVLFLIDSFDFMETNPSATFTSGSPIPPLAGSVITVNA